MVEKITTDAVYLNAAGTIEFTGASLDD